jgi:hypothetical protein
MGHSRIAHSGTLGPPKKRVLDSQTQWCVVETSVSSLPMNELDLGVPMACHVGVCLCCASKVGKEENWCKSLV